MSEHYVNALIPRFLKDQTCNFGNEMKTRLKAHEIELEVINPMSGFTRFDAIVSSGVAAIDALYKKHKKPLRLIGDSMGGFIAANYTNQYPQIVDRLVLLSPAFNLETNWLNILNTISPDTPCQVFMQKWKEEGQLMMQTSQMTQPEPVSYNYVVDSLSYPAYPLVDIPVLLFSGAQDTIIPSATQQEWKKRQNDPEKINIVELQDGHVVQSVASWEIVVSAIVKHFE